MWSKQELFLKGHEGSGCPLLCEVRGIDFSELLAQALSGSPQVLVLRERLPSSVQEKYAQLPDGYPNILVVIAPPEVQFDEFQDLFTNTPSSYNIETGEFTQGGPIGVFYEERVDGEKIYKRISAVIMWKDNVRRYLLNPNVNLQVTEELVRKMAS